MGKVYDDLGEKKKALEYYEQALPLRRRVGDVSGEATTLNNMGLVSDALGEKKKALEYFEQARLLVVRIGDPWVLAVVLDNLGALLPSLGRPGDAVARLREAAALYLQRPDRDAAVGSLRQALDVSCKYRLLNSGRQVLDDLRKAGASEDDLALAEARLLGRAGVERSAVEAAWRKVLEGAKALDGEAREMRERVARAGLERASHGSAWNGCAGVLVSRVVAGGPAESLGLRAGDILLRYGGDCLDLPKDFREHTARSAPETAISIDVWRDGRIVPLQGKGGALGLALQPF
jgi:tetratricopeptide (TPR) repeat protein